MRQIQIADLTASANEIDTRLGPIPGRSSDRIANELRWAAGELDRLLKEREAVARAIFGDGWKCCLNLGPYVESTVKELADLRAAVAKTRTNLAGLSKSDDDIYAAMMRRLDGATPDRDVDGDNEGVDPTGTELLKPRGNDGVVNAEICFNALLLMGDVDISEERVATWTPDNLATAYDWAMRRHLAASDNDDVVVPPRPAFIPVAKFGGF